MVKPVPDGLHTITPALTIDGASDAMAFYVKAFGAEEVMRAPDPSGKRIWHAEMKLGNSHFYLNDTFPEMGAGPNMTRLWVYVDGVDAAYKRAVDAGCKVRMALDTMFWGDRLGTLNDPWGNEWTLAQRVKEMTQAEMQKAGEEFAASAKQNK